jgi:hypothetical protein
VACNRGDKVDRQWDKTCGTVLNIFQRTLSMMFSESVSRSAAFTLFSLFLLVGGYVSADENNANSDQVVRLTNEAIFADWEYQAKRPGTVRWVEEGAAYTALETAPGYEDVELEKDMYGDDIKLYEEIVNYDPATLERTVLITLAQLTPKGSDKAHQCPVRLASEKPGRLLGA